MDKLIVVMSGASLAIAAAEHLSKVSGTGCEILNADGKGKRKSKHKKRKKWESPYPT